LKKPVLLLLAAILGLAVLLFVPFFFQGRVLWSQDIGRVYYPVAALLRNVLLTLDAAPLVWNPNLGAGFPLVADGVSTPFYPLHWPLLILLSPARALTAALFLGYAGSALAMAAFVRALGLSRPAALVASLAYGWCGFAVGHSVHVNVVAGLPFLPLCLLFLERARKASAVRNATLAGLCWGLLCLGGHPQVALMAAGLGSAYGLVRLWPRPATAPALTRYSGRIALFLLIGAGVSAIYYLPMAELASQSVRPEGGLSRDQAVAYALPLPHLVTAISPFFFFDAKIGGYWGAWNPAEMALYSGLATVTLAVSALWLRPREPLIRFLAGVAAVSLMLALGDATPLHGWIHWLPVFRSLRAPARYVLLLDFALAVLAAFGLDALRQAHGRMVRSAAWGVALAALVAFGLPFLEPLWRGRLAGDGWHDADWAAGSPFLLAFKWLLPSLWLGLTALWLGRRPNPASVSWLAAGVLLVAADLGTFVMTSFGPYWVRPEVVEVPDVASALAASAGTGRVYVTNGPEPWRSASDLSLVLGFRSLSSYMSLPLARHAAYMRAFWLSDQTAFGLLDAAAVNRVVDSWKRPLDPRSEIAGEQFSPRHPLVTLGPSSEARQVRFDLSGVDADRLQLVTTLQDGAQITQGTEVAIVTLERLAAAPPLRFALRAGHETGERLRDERTAHAEPTTKLQAWSLVDRSSEGAFYLARFAWPGVHELRALTMEYTATQGRLLVFGASLRAGDAKKALSPFMGEHFRRVREEDGAVLYENGSAHPRAFAVHRLVRAMTPADAVEKVASGHPASNEAVVVEDEAAPKPTGTGPSTVSIVADEPTHVELAAAMNGDGYVVLADTSYPGWQATVNGTPTVIYTANGMFRTVFVPDGAHRVRFDYAPKTLYRGLAVTLATILTALMLLFVPGKRSVSE
jgi:Bacterial membrane protein YfhO